LLLGLVSDTHGYVHPRLAEALGDCDAILHAGDVGVGPSGPAVLAALEALAPTTAVFGNIDDAAMRQRLPEWTTATVGGLRVAMTHIGGHPGRWAAGVKPRLERERPDVFVCGHSHRLQIERVPSLGGMLFVNPGAAGQQGFHTEKTCVRLAIEDGRAVRADVVHLDG